MRKDRPTTEYRGVTLILMSNTYGDKADCWMATDSTPIKGGTMEECIKQIDAWEVERQREAGMRVWSLTHDNPKYWGQRDAVFRATSGYNGTGTHRVMTRNGSDPDGLYGIDRGDTAPVTPEVEAAIEAAREAFDAAVEAGKAWKAAKKAIPRLSAEEWSKLPMRGQDE